MKEIPFFLQNTTDSNGNVMFNDVTVGIDEDNPTIPSNYELISGWPNPRTNNTELFKIQYQVAPPHRSKSTVNISIYDILGQKVRELVDDKIRAGQYITKWDGRSKKGTRVTTGIYLYMMNADGIIKTGKIAYSKKIIGMLNNKINNPAGAVKPSNKQTRPTRMQKTTSNNYKITFFNQYSLATDYYCHVTLVKSYNIE